jgi:tryptophan-rich sensory protein
MYMNDTSKWYQDLNKPGWAPPESLFGQVWSVLYVIIFVVNGYVLTLLGQGKIGWMVALPFWLNLFFNAIFTPIQFGLRNNLLAVVDILLVLGTIIWAMIVIWPHAKWVAVAFVPYLVWVSIATVLQISIFWFNR